MVRVLDDERNDWWNPAAFSFSAPFSIIAYVTILAFVIVLVGSIDLRSSAKKGPARILFCISAGLICRAVWELAHFNDRDNEVWMRLMNRFAMLFQFSAVSLLMLGWASVVYRQAGQLRCLRGIFIATNALLYALTLATSTAGENTFAYRVNLLSLAVVFGVTALGVLVWACSVAHHLRKLEPSVSVRDSDRLKKVSRRVVIVSTVLAISFACRIFAFSYSAGLGHVGGDALGYILYPYFYYVVPELIPAIAIFIAIYPKKPLEIARSLSKRSPFSVQSERGSEYENPGGELLIGAKPEVDDGGYMPLPGDAIHSAMVADSDEPLNEKGLHRHRHDDRADYGQRLSEADSRGTSIANNRSTIHI